MAEQDAAPPGNRRGFLLLSLHGHYQPGVRGESVTSAAGRQPHRFYLLNPGRFSPGGAVNFNERELEMAKLTAKRRNALPKKDFGEPGQRKYPMPDKSHAANAKARASQAVNAGRMSPAEKARIVAKANRMLAGKG